MSGTNPFNGGASFEETMLHYIDMLGPEGTTLRPYQSEIFKQTARGNTNFLPLPKEVRRVWGRWLVATMLRDGRASTPKEKTNKEVVLEKW